MTDEHRAGPSIVLVSPSLPENVGAAARGMANFGLSDLRIVTPACDLHDGRARVVSTHGESVLASARVYPCLTDALADRRQVWATTAMQREFRKPLEGPRQAAARFTAESAIVFGPERTGLTYEDLTWAHALLTFPTHNDARALNLGVAVTLVAWEWSARAGFGVQPTGGAVGDAASDGRLDPAPMGEQSGLLTDLEAMLDEVGWAPEPGLHQRTVRSLRTLILRAGFTRAELTLLRGVFRGLRRGPR
ncbi:MAG: RNA methyltransferase [Myxococcales bacterium]|nr:RNA methyltransferase [Myxococcales bacterium]